MWYLNGCFHNFPDPMGYFDRVDVQIIGDFVLAIPKIGVNAFKYRSLQLWKCT